MTQTRRCATVKFAMRREWNLYEEPAARRIRGNARASVKPNGVIMFDIETYRKLGEPEAMFLMYERSTRSIGLRPAHPDESHAVLVRFQHERTNRVVRSRGFFLTNNIVLPATMRIPYPYIENNILILDLRTGVSSGRESLRKARRQ